MACKEQHCDDKCYQKISEKFYRLHFKEKIPNTEGKFNEFSHLVDAHWYRLDQFQKTTDTHLGGYSQGRFMEITCKNSYVETGGLDKEVIIDLDLLVDVSILHQHKWMRRV